MMSKLRSLMTTLPTRPALELTVTPNMNWPVRVSSRKTSSGSGRGRGLVEEWPVVVHPPVKPGVPVRSSRQCRS